MKLLITGWICSPPPCYTALLYVSAHFVAQNFVWVLSRRSLSSVFPLLWKTEHYLQRAKQQADTLTNELVNIEAFSSKRDKYFSKELVGTKMEPTKS